MPASPQIKSQTLSLGADKCGIADAGRFDGAPGGFHPHDIYRDCKSVIVFLKRMPVDTIKCGDPVVYSHTAGILYETLDRIGMELCFHLEKEGIRCVAVPTDVPYLAWDPERKHGMGILSMRHAACKAGLGFLGRNTLLINRDMGNLAYIGAILTNAELEPDPMVTDMDCPPGCRLCLDACPVEALDGTTVNQKLCREYSNLEHPRGWDLYTCSECRKVCPMMEMVKL